MNLPADSRGGAAPDSHSPIPSGRHQREHSARRCDQCECHRRLLARCRSHGVVSARVRVTGMGTGCRAPSRRTESNGTRDLPGPINEAFDALRNELR